MALRIITTMSLSQDTPPAPAIVDSSLVAVSTTGETYWAGVQNIGTSAEQISIGEVSNRTLGYISVKNLDTTNFVQLATDSGVSTGIFTKLLAGESACFPANANAVYAKANTAACNVRVFAIERDMCPQVVNIVVGGTSAASGNITLSAPGSALTNDIWIAIIHSGDNVAHSFTDWTQIFQANGGSTDSRLSVWYHRYAGVTPNLTVTHAAGSGIIGAIGGFRYADTSGSPIDTTGAGGSGTDDTIEHSSVTPSVNSTLILLCNGSRANNTSGVTLPAGFSNVVNGATASGGGSRIQMAYKRHFSGAVGAKTVTDNASATWASVMLALGPA